MRTLEDLKQRQALPMEAKVSMSMARIREWYNYYNGDVCISFSGGKDSTVLAHLVHDLYPNVPLVFSDTGLEFPEIRDFAHKMGAVFIRPKRTFKEVLTKFGYPLISKEVADTIFQARKIRNGTEAGKPGPGRKFLTDDMEWHDYRRKSLLGVGRFSSEVNSIYAKEKWLLLAQGGRFRISPYCCNVMKKNPLIHYQKDNDVYPFIGTLAEESKQRERAWIKHGCNVYESAKQVSQPLLFWTEQDILEYIYTRGLEISSVYGEVKKDLKGYCCTGCRRTGCIFCCFGVHLEKESRFKKLAITHPKLYDYCMRGGKWVINPRYDSAAPKYDGLWKNWNPQYIWVPSADGLGMAHVFDEINNLYGETIISY